jgi:hypothetical protein
MNPYYTVISQRANHRCEYCKAPEVVFNFPFEVEHIVPLSRQGSNDELNLALSCRSCNLRKGNRIFHPREDQWSEHFQIDIESGEIVGKTLIGEVTVKYLEMNSPAQVTARQLWIRLGLFP